MDDFNCQVKERIKGWLPNMPDYSVDQELVQSGEGSLTFLEPRFLIADHSSRIDKGAGLSNISACSVAAINEQHRSAYVRGSVRSKKDDRSHNLGEAGPTTLRGRTKGLLLFAKAKMLPGGAFPYVLFGARPGVLYPDFVACQFQCHVPGV